MTSIVCIDRVANASLCAPAQDKGASRLDNWQPESPVSTQILTSSYGVERVAPAQYTVLASSEACSFAPKVRIGDGQSHT
jgi:hypothetical protein